MTTVESPGRVAPSANPSRNGHPSPAPARSDADLSWTRHVMRWGQINIREVEPPDFDVAWWEEYWKSIHLDGQNDVALDVPGGDGIELILTFAPSAAATFGLAVQGTDEILYDRAAQTLAGRPLSLARDEPLTIRVFVDRSVIEVFAHGRACKTIRTYHQPADTLNQIRLIARGAPATVKCLDVWQMGSFEA